MALAPDGPPMTLVVGHEKTVRARSLDSRLDVPVSAALEAEDLGGYLPDESVDCVGDIGEAVDVEELSVLLPDYDYMYFAALMQNPTG